jgi:hypothetical protein
MKHGVRVAISSVAGAGKGLFAKREFKANEWICPYGGEVINKECLALRYPGDMTAPYAEASGINVADGACTRGIGSMANARFNAAGRVTGISNHNATTAWRPSLGQFWLKARGRIVPGAEIFHFYGSAYRLDGTPPHTTKRGRRADTRPC